MEREIAPLILSQLRFLLTQDEAWLVTGRIIREKNEWDKYNFRNCDNICHAVISNAKYTWNQEEIRVDGQTHFLWCESRMSS